MDQAKRDHLTLRARLVVTERAALAALELALRIRPEELSVNLEVAREGLVKAYQDPDFAGDVADAEERTFLAKEVERLMRGLQYDMGFREGELHSEDG